MVDNANANAVIIPIIVFIIIISFMVIDLFYTWFEMALLTRSIDLFFEINSSLRCKGLSMYFLEPYIFTVKIYRYHTYLKLYGYGQGSSKQAYKLNLAAPYL